MAGGAAAEGPPTRADETRAGGGREHARARGDARTRLAQGGAVLHPL